LDPNGTKLNDGVKIGKAARKQPQHCRSVGPGKRQTLIKGGWEKGQTPWSKPSWKQTSCKIEGFGWGEKTKKRRRKSKPGDTLVCRLGGKRGKKKKLTQTERKAKNTVRWERKNAKEVKGKETQRTKKKRASVFLA